MLVEDMVKNVTVPVRKKLFIGDEQYLEENDKSKVMEERSRTLPRANVVGFSEFHRNGRPSSFYDNLKETSAQDSSEIQNFEERLLRVPNEEGRSPSQAHCLRTTVPQNIAAVDIAGRHAPTRNSLRHSRMIVMTRTGKVPITPTPPLVHNKRLATALVGLQTLLGMAIICLAGWLLLWAPNIRRRDNPYWSGLPLLLSGIVGLSLLCCCKRDLENMPRVCTVLTKALSVTLSALAAAACLTASVFALIHLAQLSSMLCEPVDVLNATCTCYVNENSTVALLPTKAYHYADLNCPQVDNILTILLIFSCVSNAMAGVLGLWYVYLFWMSRYKFVYSKVRTKSER